MPMIACYRYWPSNMEMFYKTQEHLSRHFLLVKLTIAQKVAVLFVIGV